MEEPKIFSKLWIQHTLEGNIHLIDELTISDKNKEITKCFCDNMNQSFKELGQKFGVNQSRAREILIQSCLKLIKFNREHQENI